MANLSKLARSHTEKPAPSWITALSESTGFTEQSLAEVAKSETTRGTQESQNGLLEAADAEEGKAASRATEVALQKERTAFEALKLSFERIDKSARTALAQNLAETVAALCRQVLEDCPIDESALSKRCAKLSNEIGERMSDCTLYINPEDLALLDSKWAEQWAVNTDASLPRGSLNLVGLDGSICDGPEEYGRAIAAALKT